MESSIFQSTNHNKPLTVAILSPGAMGASLAHLLTSHGCRVLTSLSGRSDATKSRAREAGMVDVDADEIVDGESLESKSRGLRRIIEEADWILSIMPPGDAEGFIRDVLSQLDLMYSTGWVPKEGKLPVFVDCNAKNTSTARHFASLFTSPSSHPCMTFIDACIIGLPPSGAHYPAIYVCASPEDVQKGLLDAFEGLNDFGLSVKVMEGGGIGDASGLKMAFSGIMKGMVGLYTTMILSANSHSPAVGQALLHELHASLPTDLANIAFYVPNSQTKAYRFVREMKEMSGFVREGFAQGTLGSSKGAELGVEAPNDGSAEDVSQLYEGFAAIFQRIADSVAGTGPSGTKDHDLLMAFAAEAAKLVNQSKQ